MTGTIRVPGMSRIKIENSLKSYVACCPRGLGENGLGIDVFKMIEKGLILKMTEFDISLPDKGVLPEHIKGQTDFTHKRMVLSPSTYDGIMHDIGHDRFTVMHEMSHCLIHTPFMRGVHLELKKPPKFMNRGEIPAYEDAEWQANNGAAAFLVPLAEAVNIVCSNKYRIDKEVAIKEVMKNYVVSHHTAKYRLRNVDYMLKKNRREVMQLIAS